MPIFWPASAMAISNKYKLDRLQRLLVQHPLGDPRLRPEVASAQTGRGVRPRSRSLFRAIPLDSGRHGQTRSGRRPARPAEISLRHLVSTGGEGARRGDPPGDPRAARELPEPHLALRARRLGEPDHARPERRLLAPLFAGRRPARLHLRPHDQRQGRSLHPRRRRGEAARRHSGHGRGSALDERWRGDRRARRRSRARRRRDQRRQALWPGATTRIRRSTIRRRARRRLFRVDAATARRREVGPSDLSVWEFDLLGDGAAVALVSDDPSERGWYHTRLVAHRLRDARRHGPASIATGSCCPLRHRLRASSVAFLEGWSSDRGLVASEIRVLDLATGKVSTIAAAEASDVTTLPVARRGEPLVRRLVEARRDLRRRAELDGTVVWSRYEDAIVGSNSFLARRSRRRRTRPASPRSARRSASRRRSSSRQRCPTRIGSPSPS